MANKKLFKSQSSGSRVVPATDTTNLAGGKAYSTTDKHALAQFAATGTFGSTFYADSSSQLDTIKKMVEKVEPAFIAKLAIYSRKSAFMKDMPAYLLAVLASKDIELFKSTFPQVMDNGKMVRNFVQIIRSGVTGRKSLGSAPKRAIKEWLESRKDYQIFSDSVGNDPSLADVIKMVHPRPETSTREALYGYVTSRKHDASVLPNIVQEFEAFKTALIAGKATAGVPNVNFQMLTALPLTTAEWTAIAQNAKWNMTRMNLNTFARHGVLKDPKMVKMIADRLRDKSLIEKSKVFPYQLFTAYLNTVGTEVPEAISNALQDAMETAIENVPRFDGQVFVGVDISGSMDSPVSGYRGTATSKTSCRQVGALIASAIKRKNKETEVYTFDTNARHIQLNGHDSVMKNAQLIATPGGGTDCSATLALLNSQNRKGDLVVIVSDNESWYDRSTAWYGNARSGTGLMAEWAKFKARNPKAKLVCIDLTPNTSVQATDAVDRLNVGGFSDSVFTVISEFLAGSGAPEYWVKKIENFDGTPSSASSTETTDEKE